MYVDETSFEERQNEAIRMREKHPDRVPLIVERQNGCKLPEIDRRKWLVPRSMTTGQWLTVMRKRISLSSSQGLFVFVNNTLPVGSKTMGELYEEHKEMSGLLLMTYATQNTFG